MGRVLACLAALPRPAVLTAALALAACSSVSPDDPNRPTANPGPGTKLLLGDANPKPLTAPVDDTIKRACPPVEVLEGAGAHQVFDGSGSTDPFALRYQASIAQTARECSNLGVEAGIRVGIVGRLIIGPKGAPGAFRVPLRIAVVDELAKPVYSEVKQVDVTVPSGQSTAAFNVIEDSIVVPIPANRFAGWRILVGYDPKPAAVETKTSRRRR